MEYPGEYVGPLICTGRDSVERTFHMHYIRTSITRPEHTFRIRESLDELSSEFFELTFEEKDDDTLKVTMINNYRNPRYMAKGIPDAAFPMIAKFIGKSICSSTNSTNHKLRNNEYRTPDATKVWDRLVAIGMARFDVESDTYYLI